MADNEPLPSFLLDAVKRGPDPDLVDILEALGIPDADSKQDILDRINVLVELADFGAKVRNEAQR